VEDLILAVISIQDMELDTPGIRDTEECEISDNKNSSRYYFLAVIMNI